MNFHKPHLANLIKIVLNTDNYVSLWEELIHIETSICHIIICSVYLITYCSFPHISTYALS